MSDSIPNYLLSQQKLKAQIASLRENIERQKLETFEMKQRAKTIKEDMDTTNKELEELIETEEDQNIRYKIYSKRKLLESYKTSVLELADRMTRYIENIKASEKAIKSYESDLKSLEGEHGKVSDADIDEAMDKLLSDYVLSEV